MSGTLLPDGHHFAAQCSPGRFSDEPDGQHTPPWLHEDAFKPTVGNPAVSGSWVERVDGTFEEQLERVRQELLLSKRKVRRSHKLAVVQVELIRSYVHRYDRDLHIIHTPDPEQVLPSHSEIQGILPEDRVLQQKLADAAVIEDAYPKT